MMRDISIERCRATCDECCKPSKVPGPFGGMRGGGLVTLSDASRIRSFRPIAKQALKFYNKSNLKRFKLKKMYKVNWGGQYKYMTFSAREDGSEEQTLFRGVVKGRDKVVFCEIKDDDIISLRSDNDEDGSHRNARCVRFCRRKGKNTMAVTEENVATEKKRRRNLVRKKIEKVNSRDEDSSDVASATASSRKHPKSQSNGSKTLSIGVSFEQTAIENIFKDVGGEVVDVHFKGYGHIEFAGAEQADKALKELNGKDLLVKFELAPGTFAAGDY